MLLQKAQISNKNQGGKKWCQKAEKEIGKPFFLPESCSTSETFPTRTKAVLVRATLAFNSRRVAMASNSIIPTDVQIK